MKALSILALGLLLDSTPSLAQELDVNDLRRPGPPLVERYTIPGLGGEGRSIIQRFGEVDDQRVAEIQARRATAPSYPSGGGSSSSASSTSATSPSRGGNSSSSKPTGGVKEIYVASKVDGYVYQKIVCNNGASKVVSLRANGRWFDTSGISTDMGDRYRGMSISQVGNELCK